MRYHHVAIFVSDMEQSLECYRDLLGMEVLKEESLPNGTEPGDGVSIYESLMNELWQYEGARSRCVLLAVEGAAFLELQQTLVPAPENVPPENLRYHHTGFRELAFEVDDIDAWFEKITSAGHEPTSKQVWTIVGKGRSFLFPDPDGNLIQLWQRTSRRLT
jgi:catechol 2,3-dioxygenase-like lactoylglutathione lyase family enzyme